MKVAVWDTYVRKSNSTIMHFGIIVPENIKDVNQIYAFGMEYLKSKGNASISLTSNECRLCHIENTSSEMDKMISEKGYYIVEMENC